MDGQAAERPAEASSSWSRPPEREKGECDSRTWIERPYTSGGWRYGSECIENQSGTYDRGRYEQSSERKRIVANVGLVSKEDELKAHAKSDKEIDDEKFSAIQQNLPPLSKVVRIGI